MKYIFIVNGYPLSGKDTFIDYYIAKLTLLNKKGIKFSSVDSVKKAATILGWDGNKDEKGRNFLSILKDLSTEYYDKPFYEIITFCEQENAEYIFLLVREPEEINKLKLYFEENSDLYLVRTVLIKREESLTHLTNTGDSLVENYIYDITITNTSLDKLLILIENLLVFLEESK